MRKHMTGIIAVGCLLGGCGGNDQFVMKGSFASSSGVGGVQYHEVDGKSGGQALLDGGRFSIPLAKGKTYYFSVDAPAGAGMTVGSMVFCDGMKNTLSIPSSAEGSFDFGQFSGSWNFVPQNRPAWLTCSLTTATGTTGSTGPTVPTPTPSMERCTCQCVCENCIATTEGQLANPGQTCVDLCPDLCSGSAGICGFWQGTILSQTCVPEPNP